MKCQHCDTELTPHADAAEGNAKFGALHCNGCNCCFQGDGKTPREGVAVCAAGLEIQKEERREARETRAAEKADTESKPVQSPRRGSR